MTRSTLTHALWLVLRNQEGRYSVAPASHPLPVGWEPLGPAAPREDCLLRIAETWTDMRPAGLKEAMA